MQTRIVVYPYKLGSESGKKVATALDALRIKAEGDYHPRNGDFIVGWGNGHPPIWGGELKGKDVVFLNRPDKVALSVNKIDTFNLFKKHGVPHPDWSFHSTDAIKWFNQNHWVCCRQSVEGKDGEGLILAKTKADMVPAKLYTRYMPIAKEFRVYVFGDELLDIREKRRDTDALKAGKVNEYIRTTSGNWVYCQYGFKTPSDAREVAVAATKALGLDFAGVDIIQAKEDGKCYALETNTAPYVGDHTVSRLRDAIIKRHKEFVTKTIAPKWW
jgi:hypothetical protein